MCTQRGKCVRERRGVVAVQVAVVLVVLIGFAALTVDLGAAYNTKAELQRTADAAALAAASRLTNWTEGNPLEAARAAAVDYVSNNPVMGKTLVVDAQTDVVFGRTVFDSSANSYEFTPTTNLPDAVQITIRHTADSPNGPVPLYFARVFGKNSTQMSARALAAMVPRDIAIVADLSGSQNDDSEFRNYRLTDINIWDVWDNLPGGADSIDGTWAPEEIPAEWVEDDGDIPQAAGPGWGYFKKLGWGTEAVTSSYSPSSDNGLVYLPKNQYWSNSQLRGYLEAQGYITSEVNAIMSQTYDGNGAYPSRVAVALGLAFWNSGQPGGLWEQRGVPPTETGNGNNWISGSELNWNEMVFDRTTSESRQIWNDYINNYMSSTSSQMNQANSQFRYRYGLKTFVNYLMERRTGHNDVPELADAPTQPLQSIKDAVVYMTQFIDDLDTDDQLSLEVYATTAHHEVDLTHDHTLIAQRLAQMQAGHYDTWTNIGGGIETAIAELTGPNSRVSARKMIILLTDGIANVNASGGTNDPSGGRAYTLSAAQAAVEQGIVIFGVSVGAAADQSLMVEVADMGSGEHFHAEGSIEEYSAQLADIFRRLGGTRPVELLQ